MIPSNSQITLVGFGQWGNHLGQLMLAVRLAELHDAHITFYADPSYFDHLSTIFNHPQITLKRQRRVLRRFFTYLTDRMPIFPSEALLSTPQFGRIYCSYGHHITLGWSLDQYQSALRICFGIPFDDRKPEIVFHYRSYLMRSYLAVANLPPSVILHLLHALHDHYGLPIRFMADVSTRWRQIESPDEQTFREALALPFVHGDPSRSFFADWFSTFSAHALVTVSGSSFANLSMIMRPERNYLIGDAPYWQIYDLMHPQYIDLRKIIL